MRIQEFFKNFQKSDSKEKFYHKNIIKQIKIEFNYISLKNMSMFFYKH